MPRAVIVERDDEHEYALTFSGTTIDVAGYTHDIDYPVDNPVSLSAKKSAQRGIAVDILNLTWGAEAFGVFPDRPQERSESTFLGNVSWDAMGLPGTFEDIHGVKMSHLHVQDEGRGMGIGRLLFDWYRAAAVYVDGVAAGAFGGGTDSADFLTRQGVPENEINRGGGAFMATESVSWTIDADELVDDGVTVI